MFESWFRIQEESIKLLKKKKNLGAGVYKTGKLSIPMLMFAGLFDDVVFEDFFDEGRLGIFDLFLRGVAGLNENLNFASRSLQFLIDLFIRSFRRRFFSASAIFFRILDFGFHSAGVFCGFR